jgi:hypothetical protein
MSRPENRIVLLAVREAFSDAGHQARAYRADGKLTPAERKDLHQDLNQTSKDIHQEKHDSETRPGTAPASSPKPVK